ncbi:1-aminocyclopropane-1-carboxylate synthase-like protein 1 [Nephila pilipes]|uniref:1-aminocyclopropane-1-carboxylate synthase-like protein 1 n=1 Tax=Nephila pilipes TaxID=299642 RepID=A0A8X6P8P0_NEPPI|nr:1-aminocyclopropane-1-carboxylate synthase-like protein 1 [Nephila pilipes]
MTIVATVWKSRVVKAILLINPHNPLGSVYSPELLLEIFSFCNEHNLHVIVDEVYALSTFSEGPQFHSTLKFPDLPNKEKVHVLYGISKDFGSAGLRVGAIYTRNEALQNCLKELSAFQTIPFPIMDIAARLIGDLEWCKSYLAENKQRLSERFKFCAERLKKLGLTVHQSFAGFSLWVDFKSICGSESFEQEEDLFLYLLENARLFIVPGKQSFCEQPGWFRINFTYGSDYVNKGLTRKRLGIEINLRVR